MIRKKYNYNIIIIIIALFFTAALLLHQAKAASNNNDFDILWQANTYTPYWYEGKAMAGIYSQIKAVVINLSSYSPASLTYDWYVNFEKDFKGSGKGKNFFITTIKQYEDTTISVKIYNNKKLIAEKGVILSADDGEPKLILYRQNPLLGESNLALPKSIQLKDNNIIIKAEPYYFSLFNEEPTFNYVWKMNNNEIPGSLGKNALILKKPANERGVSFIEVNITNSKNIYQRLKKAIKINYGF